VKNYRERGGRGEGLTTHFPVPSTKVQTDLVQNLAQCVIVAVAGRF